MTPEEITKLAESVYCERVPCIEEAIRAAFNAGMESGARLAEDYADEWKDSDLEPAALTICNAIRARLSQKEDFSFSSARDTPEG